ncbi:MAG: Eco57I restriction-modification methylase domain-containing protein [Tannerella sp.]|jgi:hypothetical protein|nr:Eco57I restriction-modification methylase domain-containing protein [Tannerella sp.]
MFYTTTAPELSDKVAFAKEAERTFAFRDHDCYRAFIRQFGLEEVRDGADTFLTPLPGENRMPDFEQVAAAMDQLQKQTKWDTERTLSALTSVIDGLDRVPPLPQYVVSYMCRDVLTRVVLQRFNETIGCSCTGLMDLSYLTSDNVAEANDTFNAIRYCDPAMGSGRFLVSLMNEIIAVKSQLGILTDKDGNPLFQYKIVVHGDRLTVLDKKHFNEYAFNPANPESRRIREAFLREKRICIEKCLYGVDINPVSVMTCRLRLWLELLKHTCLQDKQPFASFCIESNVRCGDALVSRFPVGENLRTVFKRIGYSANDYKKLAKDYRMAKTGEEKEHLAKTIALIHDRMQHEIVCDEKHGDNLRKWQRMREELKLPSLFAPDTESEKTISDKLYEVEQMVEKYKRKAAELKNNPVYEKAVEWRYEFPELLNDTGDFVGFDAIIGNPPDTQKEIIGKSDVYKQMSYAVFSQTGEVSSLFLELGNKILRPDGFLSLIASGSWMHSVSAGKMRRFLLEETNPLLMLEFDDSGKTDRTLRGKGLVVLQKSRNQCRLMTCKLDEHFDPRQSSIEDFAAQHAVSAFVDTGGQTSSGDVTPFGILSETEKSIKNKLEQAGIPLRMWDIQMYAGIETGCDEAFIIDEKTKDSFVRADYKNTDIIKPLLPEENIRRYMPEKSDRWIICIPWHFPLLYDKSITCASRRAEERFAQQYPVIYEHLLQYRDKLISRDVMKVGTVFEWYALQRLSMSNEWDDFTQQKIVWRQESPASDFCFDYGGCAVLGYTGFIIGQHLKYLLGFLNSGLGQYLLKDSPHGNNGDMQISILALEALRVPAPGLKIEADVVSLVNKRTSDASPSECEEFDRKIDRIICEICGLTGKETEFIEKDTNHLLT